MLKNVHKTLYLIILESVIVITGFFSLYFALFGTSSRFYVVLTLIVMTISAIVTPSIISYRERRGFILKCFGCFALILLLFISINEYIAYQNWKIPVLSDGVDIGKYEPFSENVPRLPDNSTLRIEDNIPVLDGALALYPLYAAYATALYPVGNYSIRTNNRANYDGEHVIKPHPVHFTNTIRGFEGLLNGRVDIFFMADISAEQKQMALDRDIQLKYTPLGREAFVFFVNANNPVDNLSIDQIRGIYSGKITRWEELGWHGNIKAFQRNKNSGSQSALERLMGEAPLMEAPVVELPSGMGGIIRDVADYKNHENAIGYSFRYFTNTMAKSSQIKLLKIDGIAPTIENIHNGSYPLAAPYYAITREDNKNQNVQKMLEWFVSEQGQYLVRKVMEE